MAEKTEEAFTLSDGGDAADCDDGTASPTPVTVPKKRGRPANAEKPKKAIIPASGRGRGRPPKGGDGGGNKKPNKVAVSGGDGSEEEGTASDGGSPTFNGDSADAPTAVASKRGRKPKAKRKISHIVDSTGKGRGRPKKLSKTDDGDDIDDAADDNEDGANSDYKPGKKAAAKPQKKGRGRPKKVQSDDESSDSKQDDDEERRPVGRPPSGGVNLNIVSTGRGQGRPKKKVAEKRAAETAKHAADTENGGGQIKKQRGRPATSNKAATTPTGKSRGRPKNTIQEKDSQDDDEDVDGKNMMEQHQVKGNPNDAGEENSGGTGGKNKASSESEDVA